MARTLAISLGLKEFEIVSEGDLDGRGFGEKDVIVIGYPGDKRLLPELPAGSSIANRSFTLNGHRYDTASESFFGVFRHPSGKDRVLAMFLPLSTEHAEIVAGKITHYGRYSYLVFQGDRNTEKGSWEVTGSPVVHEWNGP